MAALVARHVGFPSEWVEATFAGLKFAAWDMQATQQSEN